MYSRFGSPPPLEGTFWSTPFFRDSEKFHSVDLFLQAANKRLKGDCNSSVKISKERQTMVAARCDQHENGCPFRLRALRSESGTFWSVPSMSCEWKHVHPGRTPSPSPPYAPLESEAYKTLAKRTVVLYDRPTFFAEASSFFLDIRVRSNSAYGYPCVPYRQLTTSLTAFCAGRYGSECCGYKIRAIRTGSGWKAVPQECNWTHSHDAKQVEAQRSPPVDERVPARLPTPASPVPRTHFIKVSEIRFPKGIRPQKKFPKMPEVCDVFDSPGHGLVAAVANIVIEYAVSTGNLWWDPVKEILACKRGRDTASECGYRMRLERLHEGSRIVLPDSNLSHNHEPAQVKRRHQAWVLAQNPPYIFDIVALRLPTPLGKLLRASRPAPTSDSRNAKRRRLSSPSRAASPSAPLAGPSGLSHPSDRVAPRTSTQGAERESGAATKPAVKQEPEQDELEAGSRSPGPRAGKLKEAVVLAPQASSTSVKQEEDRLHVLAEPDRPDEGEEILAASSESQHLDASAVERSSTAYKPEPVESSFTCAPTSSGRPSVPTAVETTRATASDSDAKDAAETTTACSELPASTSTIPTAKEPSTTLALPESASIPSNRKLRESGLPGDVVVSSAYTPPTRPPPPAPHKTPLVPDLHAASAASEDPDDPDPRQVRLDAIEAFLLAIEPALVPSASVLIAAGVDSQQALFDFVSLSPAVRRTLLRRLDKQGAGPAFAGLARILPS